MTTTHALEKNGNQALAPAEQAPSRPVFSPRADIRETGDAIEIFADMPGVTEEGLDITLEKNQLTIRGKVEQYVPDAFRSTYWEYEMGDYERTFVLSNMVDRDHIAAELNSGVLHVHLPKVKEATPRKIPVVTS